ncbi:MAG: TraR/DksA C4-type zinc finger protein [Verrucomicrobiae bacterium]|nr:TraR/DksA C4-type zinc finger protein [Verrucomicrobiae bacterium]
MKKKTKSKKTSMGKKTARKKPSVKRAKTKAARKSAPSPPPVASRAEAAATQQAPKKLKLSKEETAKFRHMLLELRDHLIDGVSFLADDNLRRSNRDVSGELSGYSLHMADAGTDNFDREFALSLVSSEQDALYEIEEALKRLEAGTYGICEMCEKVIPKERLEAVPFARMCVHCQAIAERENRRRPTPVTGIFSESAEEETEEREENEE